MSDGIASRVGERETPVASSAGAERTMVGAWLTTDGTKPGTQTGPLTALPVRAPTESATEVPTPSLRPQRATRPVPEVSSTSLVAWIWASERATFQTRASSRTPAK